MYFSTVNVVLCALIERLMPHSTLQCRTPEALLAEVNFIPIVDVYGRTAIQIHTNEVFQSIGEPGLDILNHSSVEVHQVQL